MDAGRASLAGRTAVVTGGGAGIGKGIAVAYAASGASVGIVDRDADAARTVADAITASGGRARALTADVRDPTALEQAVADVAAALGCVDVLVNNAGGTFAAPFLESTEKGWDALLRANLKPVLSGTQIVARRLVTAGRGGSVVNVVSIEAARAAPGYAAYAAAKAGVTSLTQTLALELAPHGIRVNAIAPDICLTEGLVAMVPAEERERWRHLIPLGRAAEPADVAGAAIFLASDLARYVTGVVLPVDGGTHAAGGWYRDPASAAWTLGPPRGPRAR